MEQNSVAKDFMADLAKLLDEYKVEMLTLDDSRVLFASKTYDFEIETSGYCCETFDNVALRTEIGTYKPKKV